MASGHNSTDSSKVPKPDNSRAKVTAQRLLLNVPSYWLTPRARALKDRLLPLIPAHCLDYGWMKGRRQSDARRVVAEHPSWEFCDIRNFFPSVPQDRLWRIIHRLDAPLCRDLQRFCTEIECTDGLPEGCSWSPAAANLYLSRLDERWQGRMVRVGDNFASDNSHKLRNELLMLGFSTVERDVFVGRLFDNKIQKLSRSTDQGRRP